MALSKVLYMGQNTSGFTAADDRVAWLLHRSEGVLPHQTLGDVLTAFAVNRRAAGANFSVDVLPGLVLVQADDVVMQGNYLVYNDGVTNLPNLMPSHTSLPRIDQIVVQVNDAEHSARTPVNSAEFKWLYGTATSGATLVNRTGAVILPPSTVRLADVLVSANSTSIDTSAISDRRDPSGPLVYDIADGSAHAIAMRSGSIVTVKLT